MLSSCPGGREASSNLPSQWAPDLKTQDMIVSLPPQVLEAVAVSSKARRALRRSGIV